MSAIHSRADAMIGWTDDRVLLSPRALFFRLLEAGLPVASLARIRQFFDDIRGGRGKPPGTGGGPGESPEEPGHDSPWDDPALWMLMMH
jgi:hypothetical protein